jgi:hypothetical protein
MTTTNKTLTSKEIKTALRYAVKAKRPVMIKSGPGVGKSDTVAALCREMGGILYDVRLSQMEQTDLRGMPYFNKDTGKMEWAAPVDLPDAETASQYPIVFLFLDEMNSAQPSVLAAAYQLMLNRKVGTYSLPENCVILAAGNREGDRGVVYRIPKPLANRMIHLEMRVDFESWNEWAIENRIHRDVVGFINFSKDSLCDFDPKDTSDAFPTPRTWEYTSDILTEGVGMDLATETALIAGTIGEGMALKFLAHRRIAADMPNPSDILSGKVKELKNKEISAQYSLVTSLMYELADLNDKVKAKTAKEDEFHEAADNMLGFILDNLTMELQVMGMRAGLQQLQLPFRPNKLQNFKRFHEGAGKIVMKSLKND